MTEYFDTSPTPSFLRGIQNQPWNPSGAISEFVDNSLGEGRGNATEVRITYHARQRVLTVLDNGRGMDNVGRLFRLGDTIGRTIGDIGEFGSGGTMGLIWLGREVEVWTLRDGQVARVKMDWDKEVKRREFSRINVSWKRATAANTPTDLLEIGHGTKLLLRLPQKRRMYESNIRRDLSQTYGPALRHGRRIIWVNAKGQETELGDIIELNDPLEFSVEVEVDDQRLTARGRVAVIPDLPTKKSTIAVCFGHRVLATTRDCYQSPDRSRVYAGTGVVGYVDLDPTWQRGYLSTTKSSIDDSRAWESLMAAVFVEIEPLLQMVEEDRFNVLLHDLSLEMQDIFNGQVLVSSDDGELEPDPEGDEEIDGPRGGKGGGKRGGGTQPADRKKPHGVSIQVRPRSDDGVDQQLCSVQRTGDTLFCYVNRDHPYIQQALAEKPPNRPSLYGTVLGAVAGTITAEHPDLIPRMFRSHPAVVRELESREGYPQHALLLRLLVDRLPGRGAA